MPFLDLVCIGCVFVELEGILRIGVVDSIGRTDVGGGTVIVVDWIDSRIGL